MKPYDSIEAENFYKNYDSEPSIPIFTGSRYQKGHGIGNLFSGVFRAALPLVKKGALALGKTALQTGINIAKDSIQGKDIKLAFQDNLKETGNNILTKSTKYSAKNNPNKKRKLSKKTVSSKSKAKRKRPRLTSDIFSK